MSAEEQRCQEECVTQALALFKQKFGVSRVDNKQTVCVSAPGRVNLIGEHTDYNNGFVMPLAIKYMTVVVAAKNESSNTCNVVSVQGESKVCSFKADESLKPGEKQWFKYVQGVISAYLRGDDGAKSDHSSFGFDAAFCSNVPIGGGLSSSASLEVCTATMLEELYGITNVSPMQKALRGREAENKFAFVPTGIMDQTIVALATESNALLIDCQPPEYKTTNVPLPVGDDGSLTLIVCNSNAPHELTGGEYKERVEQCKLGCEALGVSFLRDCSVEQFEEFLTSEKASKMDDTVKRRVRHVVYENERVLKAMEAAENGDFKTFGMLMYESHQSLSEDYEVSTEELDLLVNIAKSLEGVLGSRMTGGGFGGCTITLAEKSHAKNVMEQIEKLYALKTKENGAPKSCTVFETPACGGTKAIWGLGTVVGK